MKWFAPFALLFLFACSSLPSLEPYAPEVYNADQYSADVKDCRTLALKLPTRFSISKIGEKTGTGATQNLAGAAVTWYAPVLGALGGLSGESLEEFGLTDIRQQKAFIKCLDRKTEWDHSALEMEPNP